MGRAGTGKSALISAIRALLKENCTLSAPTAIAASNIKGKTIHKQFGLIKKNRPIRDIYKLSR